MNKTRIDLPIKPLSVNAAWQGRRFKTREYNRFIKDVRALVPEARNAIKGFVNIHYRFYLKNWKRTDGDNCVKCLQDIIVKLGYIEDDRKIMRYVIEKMPSENGDRIEVEIEPAGTDIGKTRKERKP